MKKVMLLLLLLVSCLPPLQDSSHPVTAASNHTITPEQVTHVTTKVEETQTTQEMVTCPDGSKAESLGACPKKSTTVTVEPPATKAVQPARQYLDEAHTKFKGYAYLLADSMMIVYGDRGRMYFFNMGKLDPRQPMTDIYFDLQNQTAVGYCSIDREAKRGGAQFDFDHSRCKDYLDKPIAVDFNKAYVKGPLDYLADYADREPMLVEDNIQTISIGGSSKAIQPSLHYDDQGKRTVLRLDKRYHWPLKIEREGDEPIDFRDTFADVMVLEGKQQKIDASWVTYQNVSEFWKKEATK